MNNDMINASLQLIGSLFIFNNCRILFNHKDVKGVSILSTIFFFVWGLWNLRYFPSLGQWWSFWAGVVMVAANSLWITMMVYYSGRVKA